jgi:hypothetical protein
MLYDRAEDDYADDKQLQHKAGDALSVSKVLRMPVEVAGMGSRLLCAAGSMLA